MSVVWLVHWCLEEQKTAGVNLTAQYLLVISLRSQQRWRATHHTDTLSAQLLKQLKQAFFSAGER